MGNDTYSQLVLFLVMILHLYALLASWAIHFYGLFRSMDYFALLPQTVAKRLHQFQAASYGALPLAPAPQTIAEGGAADAEQPSV